LVKFWSARSLAKGTDGDGAKSFHDVTRLMLIYFGVCEHSDPAQANSRL